MGVPEHEVYSDVHLGPDWFDALNDFLLKSHRDSKKFILVDSNTSKICLPVLLEKVSKKYIFEIIEIQSGDDNKNIENAIHIWEKLTRANVDKESVLISLGGGMVGDVGGFVASTILRGINHLQIPTTLLSMVDSSCGGKTGINFLGLKNQIGSFYHPNAVYINPEFLNTLPLREINSGLAEIAKHGLIADENLWINLSSNENLQVSDLSVLIKRSIEIKNSFVIKDEKDRGVRHALNFGHTVGHAIESYSLANHEDAIRHGEAVALGIIAESFLSHSILGLSSQQLSEIVKYFASRYVYLEMRYDTDALLKYIYQDKKNINGSLNFSLIPRIGSVQINQNAEEGQVRDVIDQTMRLFMSSVL